MQRTLAIPLLVLPCIAYAITWFTSPGTFRVLVMSLAPPQVIGAGIGLTGQIGGSTDPHARRVGLHLVLNAALAFCPAIAVICLRTIP